LFKHIAKFIFKTLLKLEVLFKTLLRLEKLYAILIQNFIITQSKEDKQKKMTPKILYSFRSTRSYIQS